MRSARVASTVVLVISSALSATTFSSRHSAFTPRFTRRATIASTSRMRGTLRSTTSWSVSSDAARAGSAAFLLPAGVMVPERGEPPSMMNFCMRRSVEGRSASG